MQHTWGKTQNRQIETHIICTAKRHTHTRQEFLSRGCVHACKQKQGLKKRESACHCIQTRASGIDEARCFALGLPSQIGSRGSVVVRIPQGSIAYLGANALPLRVRCGWMGRAGTPSLPVCERKRGGGTEERGSREMRWKKKVLGTVPEF